MSVLVLYFIILAEGFVTISAEILTIRQLLPVVGNSIVVTSLIIGMFLLCLAYGYRRGGQYRNGYIETLKNNFTFCAFWLGIGLSYTFIGLFFYQFRQYISQEILLALSVYLVLVTAPLVYILGQTIPITMNLVRQDKTPGATGGKILHLSTLGSFLGSVLTTLLLMEYLGVAWTIIINVCLLIALAAILSAKTLQDGLRLVCLLLMLGVMYELNISLEKNLFVATNAYGNYQVVYTNLNKSLVVNDSASSQLTEQNKGYPYIEMIKKIIFTEMKLKGKDILILGAGGFTLSAQTTQDNHFTYVDIDQNIENIVKKNFLPEIAGEFLAADARSFLNANTKKFDVIVSDVYSNKKSIPAHLLTQQYFNQVKENLQSTGVAIFNIVARPTLEDVYSQRVDNTIRSIFNACMVIPSQHTHEVTNILYVCKNNKPLGRGVYTDDLNPVTLDFFNSITD